MRSRGGGGGGEELGQDRWRRRFFTLTLLIGGKKKKQKKTRSENPRWHCPEQLLLYLSAVYFVFYFLCTLCMIIYKSHVLSYPEESLACDLGLLLLMAALEALRLFFGDPLTYFLSRVLLILTRTTTGIMGNLQETEGHVVVNLVLTGATMLLSVYFFAWQSYVLRADLIINAVLLVIYGLGGVLAFIAVARFTRWCEATLGINIRPSCSTGPVGLRENGFGGVLVNPARLRPFSR
ncbi:Transmembrane protein 80 [Merluccius polli]|uniref:Transmembrane protein 80 n=1 Tax=Merluccius polli TaxID=89951 RepID=A0AA47NQW8_MERPO|nr:Transmembrane protein 80 [Merluccius polli]